MQLYNLPVGVARQVPRKERADLDEALRAVLRRVRDMQEPPLVRLLLDDTSDNESVQHILLASRARAASESRPATHLPEVLGVLQDANSRTLSKPIRVAKAQNGLHCVCGRETGSLFLSQHVASQHVFFAFGECCAPFIMGPSRGVDPSHALGIKAALASPSLWGCKAV